jgi:hypothetical protein
VHRKNNAIREHEELFIELPCCLVAYAYKLPSCHVICNTIKPLSPNGPVPSRDHRTSRSRQLSARDHFIHKRRYQPIPFSHPSAQSEARGWLNQDMVKRESWFPVLDEQKSWISLAVRLEENSVPSGRTWMCMVDVLERKTTASFIVPEVGRTM